jgi:hypothetical protein
VEQNVCINCINFKWFCIKNSGFTTAEKLLKVHGGRMMDMEATSLTMTHAPVGGLLVKALNTFGGD